MRYSKQRELILQQVRSRLDHPTAEEIYTSALPGCPGLSLGTVYRNLNGLVEQGEVRRVAIPGQPDRFDQTLKRHDHFCCRQCGKVYDVWLPDETLRQQFSSFPDFTIEDYTVVLHGICRDCQPPKK